MTRATQLTVAECRALLETGVVGRVAMATPVGPRIAPVNYVVHEDAIVFRTAPYSELSTYGWNVDLAFEIDRLDPDARLGWSVVALGRRTSSTTRTTCSASGAPATRSRGQPDRGTST
jgi:nitroimidazol reductase NimA-like FMN-containing flavoprotein (pyridoxamine 5'-phosphate oxidase superfamily)